VKRPGAISGLVALVWLVGGTAAGECERVDSSRIAVAGGSLTEIVYFLGAEKRIVAVDSTSNFPPTAQEFPSVGYVRALSAEGLLSLSPTLVLGEDDMGPPEVLAGVRGTGVRIVRVAEAHTARGIVEKVRCVAEVLGLRDVAETLIRKQLTPTAEALGELAESRGGDKPKVAFLLQFRDGAPIGGGRGTSAHGLLDMVGAENVLTAFEGWKPVSLEAMTRATPDFIVIPKRGVRLIGGTAEVLSHPAIKLVAANWPDNRERVVVMDGMAMLGFGPRTLHTALELARVLHGRDPDGTGE